jgi:hypothetical protein
MSESQQTAVGWIEDNIQSDMTFMEIMGLIRQAKEMEKEQIIDAANDVLAQQDSTYYGTPNLGEQYNNETYNK